MARDALDGANVVLVGAFDYSYPRESVLRDSFEHANASVYECRYSDSTTFPGFRKILLLPYIYWTLIRQLTDVRERAGDLDILVVTKFNPLVLPLAAYYAWKLDSILVYDLFVSLHRTASMRGIAWPFVKLTSGIERATYRLPDHHLVGTNQFIELYSEMYRIPPERFVRIPPGADASRFYPRENEKREAFTALYWGNFLPHHGVDVILDAANELRDETGIEFVFLGTGPRQEIARRRTAELGLTNVSFEGFVPEAELYRWIARSHVCLGVFSDDPRALASITNKVCESVASGKATITEDSPAVREWFSHGENIFLVSPDDPEALAEGIVSLRSDPELVERLEVGAATVHGREFSVDRIATLLSDAFEIDRIRTQ